MPVGEQRARIRLKRGVIQEFNVYRWVGRMLIDGAAMRPRGRLLDRTAVLDASARTALGREAGRAL
jgi:trehalose 6-phosphate synthase